MGLFKKAKDAAAQAQQALAVGQQFRKLLGY
jgi:hypothetical protein